MKLKVFLTAILLSIVVSMLGIRANADAQVGEGYISFDFCEYDGDSSLPFGKGANSNCYYPAVEGAPYHFPELYTWTGATISEEKDGALLRATSIGTSAGVTVDRIPAMYRQVVQKSYRYLVIRAKTNAKCSGSVVFSSLGNYYRRYFDTDFTADWQIITLDLGDADGWTTKQSDGSYKPMTSSPWTSGFFSAEGFSISFSSFGEDIRNEILIDYIAYSETPDILLATGKTESFPAYIEGDTDGLFRPNDSLTRRDAAVIVARLLDAPKGEGISCRFADVPTTDYGYESIAYLDSLGIFTDTFEKYRPDDGITVFELTAMLVNSALCERDTLNANSYTFTKSSDSITRAEACAVINHLTGRSADLTSATLDFADISEKQPLFGEVYNASKSHDIKTSRDGNKTVLMTYDEPDFDKTEAVLSDIDKKAAELYGRIHNSKTEITPGGKCYYISPNGNDSNSGTTPDSPWKSLAKVNAYGFSAGTVVYFERGGLWRGSVRLLPGVTYTAYGEGEKPTIYGSPLDGADESLWTLVEGTTNVWRFGQDLPDCGTVVFNHGEYHSYKEIPSYNGTAYLFRNSSRVFNFKTDISKNLGIFCDNKRNMSEACPLYLRCDEGNPGALFDSIEFLPRQNIISVVANKDATVDNLRLMYTGAHAIGAGTLAGYTVTNCEFLWIGGSIQNYNAGGGTMAVRYGNAIESYGAPNGYTVENCYIHKVYDAGITHQMSGGTQANGVQKNIRYAGNLIEYCSYSIEYFLGDGAEGTPERYMENVIIEDNIMRFAGFGFGNQRTDRICMSHIKSGNHRNALRGDFIIRNNIFDRSREMLLYIGATSKEHLPVMSGNTYIQYLSAKETPNATIGRYGAHNARIRLFKKDACDEIKRDIDKDGRVYFAKKDWLYGLSEY